MNDPALRQVELERAQVSTLYELLTERLAEARARLADVLKAPAESASEAYEREVAAERLAKEIGRLEGAENGLVFGRIDWADGTTLRIGRIGLQTEDDDLPLLVDWRANAARPFYEATPVHPMSLRRRRHLRLEEHMVVGVSDELLDGSTPTAEDVVGDGPLTEALSARRTGRMQAAVATLQAEQDEIVRSAHRGVTVVQGGPGTGKTVVALHRAAYVLYAFPRAAEHGVLVVGPNTRFLDYISQVLPSLGENEVVLATCQELAGVFPDTVEPYDVASLKGSSALADALAELVRFHQAPDGDFTVRVGQESVRLEDEAVARARDAAVATGLGHNRARQVFKELLVDAATEALERSMGDILEQIDAEVAKLTGKNLDRAAAADLRHLGHDDPASSGPADEFDADTVRAGLLDDAHVEHTVEALWPRLVPGDLVRALLTDPDALAEHLPQLTEGERSRLLRAADDPWTDTDVPLLDEAASLVEGPPERIYGHVVVDEAQELTAMQWRMIVRRCPARAMTLVGDFAQAGPVATARDWKEALSPHLGPRFNLHTLTVSYRTTQEILDSTRDLLARIAPDQRPARSLRRGETPRTVTTPPDALVATVAQELQAQTAAYPGEFLGVICADARLDELTAVGIAQPARIVPASEARGLEFDGVVVVSPEEIIRARPGGERDLYVALTRATKRLCTITAQPA
ncbi:Superfamily I DNA and RNA helicase-like protein [Streptomyces bingchenggensis BCW-1]|uniref:Superfamily I DNA and RNA helicase-like protein n=1 Tax=Streptomyces bingchenggensis (strain BCW-1) TaxID=749414 RepID=D7BW90_STRBB|nr:MULTISPECIES: AAA family ATPase [Streptomyces]ADI11800.1 Superfamily I DNA and RNA helicase-like protein [Streptomyces bingchenggensis BCW-1]